jgi:hypothetical protein
MIKTRVKKGKDIKEYLVYLVDNYIDCNIKTDWSIYKPKNDYTYSSEEKCKKAISKNIKRRIKDTIGSIEHHKRCVNKCNKEVRGLNAALKKLKEKT